MSRVHGGAGDQDPRAVAALAEARQRIAAVAKLRRAELEMTQEQVAEALGCSVAYYQRVEYAKVNLSLRFLAHLAVVLGCELEDMLQPRERRLRARRSTAKKAAN
ncbi:MAG: helix-turn-helix transcriptional regulator [Sandaracinaceae bacterium]|nr:helix-turn-helix transcriptional regulator [Sandaracinaceae bacterium]